MREGKKKMEIHLYGFTGLAGVRKKTLRGPMIKSVGAADKLLRKYRVVSAANDRGAINIWRDDRNQWRCERMSYCITQDELISTTKKEALVWLKTALKKIAP